MSHTCRWARGLFGDDVSYAVLDLEASLVPEGYVLLQRVAACCSVLQCVAMCCRVLQCVAVYCSALHHVAV